MKLQIILSTIAVMGLATCAKADIVSPTQVLYTFDSGPAAASWTGVAWSSGPAGWAGGGALQGTSATSGWQNWNVVQNYAWQDNSQQTLQAMAAGGGARLSFDILVDGSSFAPGVSDWYNVSFAANSNGGGWTQFDNVLGAGPWHDMADNAVYQTHIDMSFTQLGWTPAATYFQLDFSANSGASPVNYYIDNLNAYVVPEPTMLALAGMGIAGLLIFRRRNA
jgi:hypothetical protein